MVGKIPKQNPKNFAVDATETSAEISKTVTIILIAVAFIINVFIDGKALIYLVMMLRSL